jgi:hypothetical protein
MTGQDMPGQDRPGQAKTGRDKMKRKKERKGRRLTMSNNAPPRHHRYPPTTLRWIALHCILKACTGAAILNLNLNLRLRLAQKVTDALCSQCLAARHTPVLAAVE